MIWEFRYNITSLWIRQELVWSFLGYSKSHKNSKKPKLNLKFPGSVFTLRTVTAGTRLVLVFIPRLHFGLWLTTVL